MSHTDSELEQDVLAYIEAYSPIRDPSMIYATLANDIEKITNAVIRQHLRVLLQSVVERE